MKYSAEQYQVLVKALKVINEKSSIEGANVHHLHFVVFQQFSLGQRHNRLIVTPKGELTKRKRLVEGEIIESVGTPLIDFNYDFMLYPEGCNDNHIETAMNRAMQEVLTA